MTKIEKFNRLKFLEKRLKILNGYCGESKHMQLRVGLVNFYPELNKISQCGDDCNSYLFKEFKDVYNTLNSVFEGLVSSKIKELQREFDQLLKEV
jgi:hypothetical protein